MNKEMKMLTNGLITQKYTKVMKETEYQYNAPHLYTVINKENEDELCKIHFQEGPIKDCGVNGVATEDLIAMCIDRLQHFQNSKFNCRENEMAITKLEESLMWLRKRTLDREAKGIEGTNVVDSVEDTLSQNPLYKELNTYQKEQLDEFIKEKSLNREDVILQTHFTDKDRILAVDKYNISRSCILYRNRLDDTITEDSKNIVQSTSENPIFLNTYQLEQLNSYMEENSVTKDEISIYEENDTIFLIDTKSLRNTILYKDIKELDDVLEDDIHPMEKDLLIQKQIYSRLNAYKKQKLDKFIKSRSLNKEDIYLFENPIKGRTIAVDRHRVNRSWILL